jgi:hypothetical protein
MIEPLDNSELTVAVLVELVVAIVVAPYSPLDAHRWVRSFRGGLVPGTVEYRVKLVASE